MLRLIAQSLKRPKCATEPSAAYLDDRAGFSPMAMIASVSATLRGHSRIRFMEDGANLE